MPESTHYPLGRGGHGDPRDERGRTHRQARSSMCRTPGAAASCCRPEQARAFRQDGSYIITGGLGGLGLFLAEKMAAAGCGPHRAHVRARSPPQRRWRRSNSSGPSAPTSSWNAATSPRPAPRSGLVAAATATRASVARCAARRRGGRGRHAGQHHRRAHRPRLGAKGLRRVASAPGHDRAAAGLVLLVLLGGGPGGFAGPGRLRRGQQLAGRLHPLAAGPGPSGHLDRLGSLGRDRRRGARSAEETSRDSLPEGSDSTAIAHWRDTAITPDEGAYAFEALLRHDRAYQGTRRSREHRGLPPSRNAASSPKCSKPRAKTAGASKFLAELD